MGPVAAPLHRGPGAAHPRAAGHVARAAHAAAAAAADGSTGARDLRALHREPADRHRPSHARRNALAGAVPEVAVGRAEVAARLRLRCGDQLPAGPEAVDRRAADPRAAAGGGAVAIAAGQAGADDPALAPGAARRAGAA